MKLVAKIQNELDTYESAVQYTVINNHEHT